MKEFNFRLSRKVGEQYYKDFPLSTDSINGNNLVIALELSNGLQPPTEQVKYVRDAGENVLEELNKIYEEQKHLREQQVDIFKVMKG